MHRTDLVHRALLCLLASVLLTGVAAPAFAADSTLRSATSIATQAPDPTPEQKAQALKEARFEAGKLLCDPLSLLLPRDFEKKCAVAAGMAFSEDAEVVSEIVVCDLILQVDGIPLLGGACEKLISGSLLAARVTFLRVYESKLLEFAGGAAEVAVTTAKFVADPTGGIDDLANATQESAVSLTTLIFQNMTSTTSVDLGASWWQAEYARATGLGLIVMVVLLLLMVKDAGSGKISSDELARSLLALAPIGVILMVFSPSIGLAVAMFSDALTNGIANYTAEGIGVFTGEVSAGIYTVTAAGLPGGAILGILLFGLMLLGSLATLVGFIVQEFAMYASAVALGIAWGMMIHPAWRGKTRKLLAFWLATALMKPALMLTLGLAFAYLNTQLYETADGFAMLTSLLSTGMILCLVGLSPWLLLKYMPLLPSGNEYSQAPSGNTASALAGAAGGALSSAAMMRYHSNNASSSSQTSTSKSQSSKSGTTEGGGGGSQSTASMPPPKGKPTSGPDAPANPSAGAGDGSASGASVAAGAAKSGSGAAGAGGGATAGGGSAAGVAGVAAQAGIGITNAALNKGQQSAREFDPQMRESRDEG